MCEELVECPRCDGGQKYSGSVHFERPYSFKRLMACTGDCFLCCDMHRIPAELAAAYRLTIDRLVAEQGWRRIPEAGISTIGAVMKVKSELFGVKIDGFNE